MALEENLAIVLGTKFSLVSSPSRSLTFATLLSRLERDRRLFTDRLGGDLHVNRIEIVVVKKKKTAAAAKAKESIESE